MNTGNSMGYDICKKAILLIVVGIVVVVSSVAQEVVNNRTNNKRYNLTNTYWAMKVENCCSNYYHFNKHGSYVYYSGEQDEYCPGVFSIKKDTLFLHEFYADEDDLFDILNREVKFIAFVSKNSIQVIYREDLIKTKEGEIRWLKTKLDNPVTYRKTVEIPKNR